MQQPPRLRPAPLALALAALSAAPGAQAIETVPLAVADAYVGAATPDKLAAALAGLRPLIAELPLITPPGPCWYCGYVGIVHGGNPGGVIIVTPWTDWLSFHAPLEEYWISGDADLAALGDPVWLAHTRLILSASFTTTRDFVIGSPSYGPDHRPSGQFDWGQLPDNSGNPIVPTTPTRPYDGGPGFIDTQGHTFKITGVLTAHQHLYKEGAGTLWLTGANVWNATPKVQDGVLQGEATSLDTPIEVSFGAQVHFLQPGEAVYRHTLSGGGHLLKSGTGVLTLTGAQQHTGGTTVAEGTLALAGGGRLPDAGRLRVESGGTLDLTGVGSEPVLRSLEGDGQVMLGEQGLTLDLAEADTSFAGAIGGAGRLSVRGQRFALTGANSFSGGLQVIGTTLGIGQGASLGRGAVVLDRASLRVLAPLHASQPLRVDGSGSLDGNGHDFVWSGEITGTGQLYKTGTGTLSLLAGNPYSGEFVIREGRVKLVGAAHLDQASQITVTGVLDLTEADAARHIRRLEGGGEVLLNADGLIMGADAADASFSGTLGGAGGITKLGTGVQALFGAADYAGPTAILAGTLRVRPQALGHAVVNHATLEFVQDDGLNAIAAWSGDIQGSGRVVKSGDGVLWLRGRNGHTGGTRVEAGVLIGNTDSLPGDIETHAGLAFYQVADGTYAGRVSGNGTLMSYGPGHLTLTGDNTHSGGTAFSNTLRIRQDRNLGGPASGLLIAGGTLVALDDLVLNRHVALGQAGARFDSNGFAIRLNGLLNGPGGVTKLGEGVLYLAGAHGYAGATVVQAGGLLVNGRLAGDVEVWKGAWLEAMGQVGGDLNLAAGAGLSPGNSPGLLEVAGDFIARGEILFEIAGPVLYDQLLIGGQADLAGATLRFALLPGANPEHARGLSFLTAAGGITGLDQVSSVFGPGLEGYRVAIAANALHLAPVPEPETWAMLLAGLGLVGIAAHRRRLR
jgi:autotransporter-associated beta strand protein